MICQTISLKDYYPFLGQDGKDPVLQSFLPYNMTEMNRQDQKRPVMLVIPGGGYSMVSQREAEPIALHFLPEGFNVFILTYSVAPHRFPSQLLEVAAAMEMIYENADAWNCDTQRIAIMGFSAGGHLTAHYTNAYDCPEVRKYFPQSKPVNASVLCYPVITADPAVAHQASFDNLVGHYPLSEQEMDKFSCDRLVTEKTPPTYLWHTAADACVPVKHSLLYAQKLAQKKVPFEMHIYPMGHHGLSTADDQTCDNLPQEYSDIKTWLSHLKTWLSQRI